MINWVITSSILILFIIVLRLCLKGKISLRLQYALWLLVAVRLLFPFSVGETVISIGNWIDSLRDTKEVQQVVDFTQKPLLSAPYEDIFDSVPDDYWEDRNESNQQIPGNVISGTVEYERQEIEHSSYTPAEIAKAIWIVGMAVLAVWFLFSNIHFSIKLKKTRMLLGNANELCSISKKGLRTLRVYQTNVVDTPCLYGLFCPAIYVTEEVMERKVNLQHVLEHEMTHYRHGDYIWSLLRVVCLVLHWYNPLVWWAAMLSRNDAELACDEATMKRLGESERASYGRTLIDLTCEKRSTILITATTMTGSKKSIKERILLITKNPKTRVSVLTGVVLLALLALVVTFTGAKTADEQDSSGTNNDDTQTESNTQEDNGDTEVGGNTGEDDEDTQGQKEEQVLYFATADLNHDGWDDRIDIVSNTWPWEHTLEENVANDGAYLKVYLGYGIGYEKEAVYTSNLVADSHASNGTYVLTEKDGKDYLLYSTFWQGHGEASYSYEVMYLHDTGSITYDAYAVEFITDPYHGRWLSEPHREDVIPELKNRMEAWIKNGEILISYDVGVSSFYATNESTMKASSYYDVIWARSDADNIAQFEEEIGTERWKQAVYYASSFGDISETTDWIEKTSKEDFTKWYEAWDGSKLQCMNNSSTGSDGGGIPVSDDIVFYRADAGEDEHDAIIKMIGAMAEARMTENENRAYVITKYRIPEQKLVQVTEHMWFISFLNGYYAFEGTHMCTMEEFINSGEPVTEDGMIQFFAQGSSDQFFHILIENDGVYRLQCQYKMQNMQP